MSVEQDLKQQMILRARSIMASRKTAFSHRMEENLSERALIAKNQTAKAYRGPNAANMVINDLEVSAAPHEQKY